MYLKQIEIKNIKCFSDLKISFTKGNEVRRWTTLFGKNGLGKSTLLQAIGVALAGPGAVRELVPVAEGWVKSNEPYGEIIAELLWSEEDALTAISSYGRPKTKSPYIAKYIVTGDDPEELPEILKEQYSYTVPTITLWTGEGTPKQRGDLTKDIKRLQQTAYAEGKSGWLGCGYGPFRRLSGGGQDADRILYAGRISARFVTLFREDAALTNGVEWLIRLHNTAREGDRANKNALEQVKKAFQENLFPEPTELFVDARSVKLKIDDNKPILLQDLSDGYRSMLALGIDLLRWLINAFPDSDNPIECPGVVLIDELDAHLHPEWQRQIGFWLREKFPNIQFIVATHSPFLAQVAESNEENRSDFEEQYLGKNIVLKQMDNGVVAVPDPESVEDLRVDQIYQTELFDMESLYSPKTEEKFKRHEELYQKKTSKKTLSEEEKIEYEQLTLWRENIPMLSDAKERKIEKNLKEIIAQNSNKLKEFS
jgi:hypothetical protein